MGDRRQEKSEEVPMMRAILFSAVLVGLFSTPAEAQRSSRDPENQPFDIDFPGGTLAELLTVIEGKLGAKPNVIASKEALEVVLTAFSLRKVRTTDVLNALEKLAAFNRPRIEMSTSGRITIVLVKPVAIRKPRKAPTWTRVYDLRDLLLGLNPYKIADIVTAVETAWGMDPEPHGARLKFHEETRLLIAMGTELELEIIDQVLREMRGGRKKKGGEAALKKATDDLVVATAQREKLQAERELARKQLEDGQLALLKYAKQLESYERQIADLRGRVRALSSVNDALRQKVKDLEEEGKKKGR
jgi:hypothetical protein